MVDVAVGRVDILPPVVVVVDESVAPAGEGQAQRLDLGGVRKREQVAAISQKLPDLAHQVVIEDIHVAVVVVVFGVRPHGRSGVRAVVVSDSQFQPFFLERAVALIDEQGIGLGVVGDEHVRPARRY
jgi:hypothetical protein